MSRDIGQVIKDVMSIILNIEAARIEDGKPALARAQHAVETVGDRLRVDDESTGGTSCLGDAQRTDEEGLGHR